MNGKIKFFVELKNCLWKYKKVRSSPLLKFFPKMATLRNKRKLAAVSRETQKYPRNSQSQSSSAPGITEEYIAQVSEEIEGRVTKKLSQEFRRTESRIFGALSKLDGFLLNPQVWTISGTVPGTFRNTDVENQEPSGDRSQNDPHSEMEFCTRQTSNSADSDQEEIAHTHTKMQEVDIVQFFIHSRILSNVTVNLS